MEREVVLVYYAFDLLHLDGWDVSDLQLIERKALLELLLANKPGLEFNGHDTGDGKVISSMRASLDLRAWFRRPPTLPTRPGIAAYGAKPNGSITRSS
jgi:bifunctional non-homologous end joining protein LigD